MKPIIRELPAWFPSPKSAKRLLKDTISRIPDFDTDRDMVAAMDYSAVIFYIRAAFETLGRNDLTEAERTELKHALAGWQFAAIQLANKLGLPY